MTESFLHYVWQFQYFDKTNLATPEGATLQVLNQGVLNTHAGPDFSQAKIRIDGMEWVGNVEIHISSSAWLEHLHHRDPAYENVVLHVVWQNDEPIYRQDATLLPALELKDRVDRLLIQEYKALVTNPAPVPCRKSFPYVDEMTKLFMLDRVLVQRLEMKALQIHEMLRQNNNDWQETAYQLLARNFGFKVNAEPFLQLSKAMPYKILLKHADRPVHVEAMLFGQAGLLDVPVGDDYYKLLQREYHVFSQKYSLDPKKLRKAHWRFLRLRPANFPTVRIAQFAALVIRKRNIFSKLFEGGDHRALRKFFEINQSDYWRRHYRFNRETKGEVAFLGESSIDNLLINSVVPLLVAFGKRHDNQKAVDQAISLLQEIPTESNAITRIWKDLGYAAKTAFDSQALMELYYDFCQKRNCLNCAIGASLLKPKP